MVPEWAGKYVGIPWLTNGRGPEGYDCWGLVRMIAKDQFGWDWPSYDETYTQGAEADDKSVEDVRESEDSPWQRLDNPDDPLEKKVIGIQTGDVIWLRHRSHVVHMGLMLDARRFIHVSMSTDSVISQVDHILWKNRVVGFYRWKS